MARHRSHEADPVEAPVPRRNVRVLLDESELAEAAARAEEGARRLRDKLEARAARDAWTAEHVDEAVGWRRFASQQLAARSQTEGPPTA